MATDQKRTWKALSDLIATCHDAEEGYGKAAKGVHDNRLSDRLAEISGERGRFAEEIGRFVQSPAGRADTDLHEGGILHRGWVDLETRIRPKDRNEILRECIEGDEGTLKHYQHALEQELTDEARSHIERQRAKVQEDLQFLQRAIEQHRSQHA